MSEKQLTFFTVNCAEKFESPNQCLTKYLPNMAENTGKQLKSGPLTISPSTSSDYHSSSRGRIQTQNLTQKPKV
jgi:hypothetical protein